MHAEMEERTTPSKRVMFIQEVIRLQGLLNPAMFQNELWTFCCVLPQRGRLQGYVVGYDPK